MYLRIAGAIALIAAAALLGYWLGVASAPRVAREPFKALPKVQTTSRQTDTSQPLAPINPPLYLLVGNGPQSDRTLVAQEIEMAVAEGIRRFVITAEMPWDGSATAGERLLDGIAQIAKISPECDILVWLSLDPPEAWLEQHPSERMICWQDNAPYASPSSELWLADAEKAIDILIGGLAKTDYRRLVSGGILSALERGLWTHSGVYDRSETAIAGFRKWLRTRYKDDAALKAAWNNATAALDTAQIPERPDPELVGPQFWNLPSEQNYVDYLRFTSQVETAAIVRFTNRIKQLAGEQAQVLVPYGFTYELTDSACGHLDFETLLNGPVDGFVSPVSYVDRGLGGVGGFMGPIDSASAHGKSWTIIDDTRTGLERDAATGTITRMPGVRAEDVYNVQHRNFAAALTHGLGVVWSDVNGQGALHDPEAWKGFGAMRKIYSERHALPLAPHANDIRPSEKTTLAVVIDEESRFYQSRETKLNEALLLRGRDAALMSGAVTQFVLLNDVIADQAPPSNVYMFLNAFHLDSTRRTALHEKLKREGAAAVWLYAPGHFDENGASAENISATTGMRVLAFEGQATSGSVSSYEGVLVQQGTAIGQPNQLQPLFYVDDPVADAIAVYKDSGRVSIGVKGGDLGWISIYIAEPYIGAELLRELLTLLELPPKVARRSASANASEFDTVHFGNNVIAIHAHGDGERTVNLTWPYDVADLFLTEVGWQHKHEIVLPLKDGETRLFSLTPADGDELP
jgi:hypothetical protein